MHKIKFVLTLSLFLIFCYSCEKNEKIIYSETDIYIPKEAGRKFASSDCITNPGVTCPQIRCRRDSYSDCKRKKDWACVDARIIAEFYPGITPEEFERINYKDNRNFMIALWQNEPDIYFHPDSIPEE